MAKRRTKPHSVRFWIHQLDLIKKKTGLNTAQQIVDMLMEEYEKLYFEPMPSIFKSKTVKKPTLKPINEYPDGDEVAFEPTFEPIKGVKDTKNAEPAEKETDFETSSDNTQNLMPDGLSRSEIVKWMKDNLKV